MHQCGSSGEIHLGLHSTEVVEDWPSIFWNTVVWPGGEVELSDLQLVLSSFVTLQKIRKLKIRQVITISNPYLYSSHMRRVNRSTQL